MQRPRSTFRTRDGLIASAIGPAVVLAPLSFSNAHGQPATPTDIALLLAGLSSLALMLFATLRIAPRHGPLVLWLALSSLILWPVVQFAYWPPLHIRQATHLLVPFLYWSMWAACLFVTAVFYRWKLRNRRQWIRIALFGAFWMGAYGYSHRNVIASDVGVPSDQAYTTVGAVSLMLSLACPVLGAALLSLDVDKPRNSDLTIHWS